MTITLTQAMKEIGEWNDNFQLYNWAIKNQENSNEEIFIASLQEIATSSSPLTAEAINTCIDDFYTTNTQLSSPVFFINMCAINVIIYSLDQEKPHFTPEQSTLFKNYFKVLSALENPLSGYGMHLLFSMVSNLESIPFSRKAKTVRDYLRTDDGAALQEIDPALWVALAATVLDTNLNLPLDDPKFELRSTLLTGILTYCAQFNWVVPCEMAIFQILENIIENREGPLFEIHLPIYKTHYDWISTVCQLAIDSGDDQEGIGSRWEAAQYYHPVDKADLRY